LVAVAVVEVETLELVKAEPTAAAPVVLAGLFNDLLLPLD
jgi:hypothetical protein